MQPTPALKPNQLIPDEPALRRQVHETIVRAVYTNAGAGLDLNNMAPTLCSNIAEGHTVFK